MSVHIESEDLPVKNSVIRVKNLTKRFGNVMILDNISVDIERGKTTVVIGPSGCGKTVLLKHMITLMRPTCGEVFFKNTRIDNLSEKQLNDVRVNYGFLFQSGALFDSMNVEDNITFPIRQHRKITDWQAVEELVRIKLAMVGMDGFQKYYPSKLSGGQRKRVALARAISLNPEIILYDEPTTGLDPIRSDVINELILKLQRELAVTSVVVTHDMTSAYKIADRIVMLHKGKIIADGDADHIHSHPDSIVQSFINGRVDDDDLAALKFSGTIPQPQFVPEDFKE